MSSILDALSRQATSAPTAGMHHAHHVFAPPAVVRKPARSLVPVLCIGILCGAILSAGAVIVALRPRLPAPQTPPGFALETVPTATETPVTTETPPPATETPTPSPSATHTAVAPTATSTNSPEPSATPLPVAPDFQISATLAGGVRPVAIIDGEVVGVGDRVGSGFTLVEIGNGWVRCAEWPHRIPILKRP